MKTSTSERKHGIQRTTRMQSEDLNFADDLALLAQSQQQMQEKTTSIPAASTAVACTNPITIDGEDLEDEKTFTYLGSIIDEHGGSVADVKARIGKARAAYIQLENILNSKQLSTNTKVRIFNTNAKTVLLQTMKNTLRWEIELDMKRTMKDNLEQDWIESAGGHSMLLHEA
ncbi:unnamed protein product [Schistosoma margrebowiei]|uniref:Uncharacterized protein n=1 Tax=Schistosoma margrebowiei TaxID=48269 RepID=A0A183MEM5_9TREM|nr:unnamed protein product [Schistosoma margrebowiei]